MTIQDRFEDGYAVLVYDIDASIQTYQYRDQIIRVPASFGQFERINGIRVANIDAVMGARINA